jgi:hypothetical protein
MKTKLFNIALFALLSVSQIFAQDVTTVRANNSDISDNLDLQAVASIFGDSRDLEDFERRLNDPSAQISNLDLNGDNRVDYLRVIEATEGNTHLIILQSVLGIDTFQDVATIEVDRDRNNNVRVQVVGDVYMYGPNYIYEPVYVVRPFIYDVFWVSSYRPYYSPWYWGYYPTYYTYWAPCPVYRYRNYIVHHINHRHTYNYVTTRYSNRAVTLHNTRRANAYERQHPDRSFTRRTSVSNRYALEQSRSSSRADRTDVTSSRSSLNNEGRSAATSSRSTSINASRSNGTADVRTNSSSARSNGTATVRSNNTGSSRTSVNAARTNSTEVRATTPARSNSTVRSTPSATSRSSEIQSSRSSNVNRSSGVQRSSSAPAVRSTPAPSVRSSAPARTAPAVRSTPAPPMRSTPAPSMRSGSPARSAGNSSRSSRG